ncbi:MAG: type VI secretion system baseplate subunit TssE [Bacteroidetes bacterium]|nr:type VI secretion system baseplate subunit TssE [Bacteroidota bacterium]
MAIKQQGARALLFERLTDFEPLTSTEKKPFIFSSKTELKESVRREVSWLLNTRAPFPAFFLDELEQSTFNYGIPDLFSLFFPLDTAGQRRLSRLLGKIIAGFEPRLKNVEATLERYDEINRSLWLKINADLIIDTISEPISFLVLLHNNMRGTAEVYET